MTTLLLLALLSQAPTPLQPGTYTYTVVPGPPGPAGPMGPPGRDGKGAPDAPQVPTGPGVDSAPAVQALVDAVFARSAADPTAFGTVFLPESALPYNFKNPVYLDGFNVCVKGGGFGAKCVGLGVPAFAPGVKRLPDPTRYRCTGPLATTALSTKGEVCLLATGCPAQLGGPAVSGVSTPDYWQGPAYCWEALIRLPADLPSYAPVLGLTDASGMPGPFRFDGGHDPGTLAACWRTSEQAYDQYRIDTFAYPFDGQWHRVTYQRDYAAGTVDCWVDGVAVPVTTTSTDRTPYTPGTLLDLHDGCTAFRVGGDVRGFTPVDVAGLAVTKGAKYRHGSAEARTDGLATNDARFSDQMHGNGLDTVFALALDWAPATHVGLRSPVGSAAGFLVPRVPPSAGNIRLESLTATTELGQAVTVGSVFGLDLIDIDAGRGSLQGVGSVPTGCSYVVTLNRCRLSGIDTPYYGYQQILRATDTQFPMYGRDGFRGNGGDFNLRNSFFSFHLPSTRTAFRTVGNEYGGRLTVEDAEIDNEDSSPTEALVSIDQSANCPNRVVLKRINASILDASVPFVRLKGRMGQANNASFRPGFLRASDFGVFSGFAGDVVRANGLGWSGVVDATTLGSSKVSGDAGAISVTPGVVQP